MTAKTDSALDDLITALTMLRKYGNPYSPIHCEHDVMTICGIRPVDVSVEDRKTLHELGFFCDMDDFDGDFDGEVIDFDEDEDAFQSFRFGSG